MATVFSVISEPLGDFGLQWMVMNAQAHLITYSCVDYIFVFRLCEEKCDNFIINIFIIIVMWSYKILFLSNLKVS